MGLRGCGGVALGVTGCWVLLAPGGPQLPHCRQGPRVPVPEAALQHHPPRRVVQTPGTIISVKSSSWGPGNQGWERLGLPLPAPLHPIQGRGMVAFGGDHAVPRPGRCWPPPSWCRSCPASFPGHWKNKVFRSAFPSAAPAAFGVLQQGGGTSGAEEVTDFSGTAQAAFPKDKTQNSRPEPGRPRLSQGRAAAGAAFPAGFCTAAVGARGYGTTPGLGTTSPSLTPSLYPPSQKNSPSAPARPERDSGEAEFSNVLFVF